MTVSKWENGELTPNSYQLTLMREFLAAAGKAQVKGQVEGLSLGLGLAATLFFLLSTAKK